MSASLTSNVAKRANQAWKDTGFKWLTLANAWLVLLILAGILFSLLLGSMDTWRNAGLGFLWTEKWDTAASEFGALGPIAGTLLTSFIALLLALPISIGVAVFLTELAPNWLRRPLGVAIELLAAIPSIIYGMWGLFVIAPLFIQYVQPALQSSLGQVPFLGQLFACTPLGVGVLTAGVVLAIMIIPFITSVLRDVFLLVPPMLKESAYGLGATTWEVVRNVVMPYTRIGMVGGVMLGLGRALGETMAVTFVIGNAHMISSCLFSPGNSIASTLANEFAEASSDAHRSALLALALVLFPITTVVLACARWLMSRTAKH